MASHLDRPVLEEEANGSSVAPKRDEVQPIERVLDRVNRDCREDAERYAEETTVPHGGE